jgi:hypothetical protein
MLQHILVKANALRKSLKNELRRSLRGAKRKLGSDRLHGGTTVGELWLGWSVGLAPLLSDCENLRNHKMFADDEPMRFRAAVARASASNRGGTGFWRTDYSYRVQYGAEWHVSNLHLFENWRLGLAVRPTLAWELTTLSFVVDYFVNIGDYLASFEAAILNNGFELRNIYKTTTYLDVRVFDEKSFADDPSPALEDDWSKHYWTKTVVRRDWMMKHKSRERVSSMPVPSLPVVKLPKAVTPLLNCAALLSQLIKRK